MKLNLLTILMLFVLFSCVNKTNNNLNSTIIDVEKKPDGAIEYESVTMTPIETIDDGLLGQDLKIRFTDSNIYIADAAHGCIFKYDKEGQFINRIGSKGKGPQEYLSLTDFRVKNDTVEIMSCVGDKTRVLRYYSNGEFISQSNYDVIAIAFERLGVNYIFSTSYNRKYHKNRVLELGRSGEVLHKYLRNKTSLLPFDEEKFSKSDSFLFYKESFDNNIYSIESDNAVIRYTVDFGKYSIPKNFYRGNFYTNFEKLNKQGFFTIRSFFENKRYAIFDLVFQSANQGGESHQLLYDKMTERVYKQIFNAEETSCFDNVIGLTETDELVYLQNAYEVTTNRDALAKLNITNKTKLNEIEANDNPVILKCKIKNN